MRNLPVIDFAKSREDTLRVWRWAVAAFGVALGGELGWFAWSIQEQHVEIDQAIVEQAALRDELERPARRAADPLAQEQLRFAQDMVGQLAVPWESLLAALEAAHGGEVVIASVVPNAQDRTVEVAAHAASFHEIAGFIDRLSSSAALRQVSLQSQVAPSAPGGSIGFVVNASWQTDK